jgi:hypothetical protein
MSSSDLMNYLKGTDTIFITDSIIVILFLLFFFAVYCKKNGVSHAFTSYAPSLLTSVGIIGTFAGIVIGLLEFNPTNIKDSIEALLEGLKVAFFTSLVGMFLSVLYKTFVSMGVLQSNAEQELGIEEVGIEELYAVMCKQEEGIAALRQAISDNDDSSLVGQIKLLRFDLALSHKETNELFNNFTNTLWIQLKDFADVLSKSATETVIDALKNVISDFNTNLTEQFGENFKQLNAAVLKLVDWQENYKAQLEEMSALYREGVLAITATEKSVTVIGEKAEAIPTSMAHLEELLTVNRHQLNDLGLHLSAFKNIQEKAVDAVPEIRRQIDLTLEGVKSANDEIAAGMKDGTEKMKQVFFSSAEDLANNSQRTNAALIESADSLSKSSEAVKNELQATVSDLNAGVREMINDLSVGGKAASDNIKQSGKLLLDQTGAAQRVFDQGLTSMMLRFQGSLEDMANEQQKQNQQIFNGLASTIKSTLSDTGESVTKQVEMMDTAMAREVERVMSEMGRALASISGQFTTDYSELVSEMRRITTTRIN